MKEVKEIIRAYHRAQAEGFRTALATVVHIEGSSYRGPGARMLILEDGSLVGAISGGCLEGDALRKALMVMMEEKPLLVTYDTTDEHDVFGVGLGCNGIIRVLIEPLPAASLKSPIDLMESLVDHREPGVLATYFTPEDKRFDQQGTRLAANSTGQIATGKSQKLAFEEIQADIRRVNETRSDSFIKLQQSNTGGAAIHVFLEYLEPVPKLVVAGAGNDILPLTDMAKVLGWEIVLVDGRPAYAKDSRFPDCRVVLGDPGQVLEHIPIDEWTAVLLMSHNFKYDKAMLTKVIQGPARYIGILGPKKKKEALLEELAEEGIWPDGEQLAKLYGPVGLDIGAETADEIALSILSGVKAAFSGKKGGELRVKNTPIHSRDTVITPSLTAYGIMVLAAGESKRLGEAKQRLVFQGKTLLERSVREAMKVGAGVTAVVLGAGAAQYEEQLNDLGVDTVYNARYREGMASSIRQGVDHIQNHHPEIEYVLIMLCDQPYVDAIHLNGLIKKQAKTGALVTASHYDGRNGVPAIFHKSKFADLLKLEGDKGAKKLIASETALAVLDFPEGAIDIDTEEDYLTITASKDDDKYKKWGKNRGYKAYEH